MSELINARKQSENFRRNLLANASMLALLGYFSASQVALAASVDEDAPTVWIELGGQFDRADDANERFSPSFVADEKIPATDIKPMIAAQASAPFSIGGEGKIAFTPRDTNWVLSVSVNYGRADSIRHLHQQTPNPYVKQILFNEIIRQPPYQQFGDGQTNLEESHTILDFQAGKDVGLGLFGANGISVISGGVRFAQFTSGANAALNGQLYKLGGVHSASRTRIRHTSSGATYVQVIRGRTFSHFRHRYTATLQSRRDAHAVGPSLSWDASLPVAGNGSDATLAMDWGVNAAVLFGRQRTKIEHATAGQHISHTGNRFKYTDHTFEGSYAHGPYNRNRSRAVTIPNIGGFAGASYRIADFKVSLGYKADFFFGALDGGIDTARKENVGFYGPFATISVGLGG